MASGDESLWTVDVLREHIQRQLADLRNLLDERHTAQAKAVDAAFESQQLAMRAALLSAEKAVTKAEIAADKRFELLNELRAGVATREQLEAIEQQVAALTSRVETMSGVSTSKRADISQVVSFAFLLIGVITLGLALYRS